MTQLNHRPLNFPGLHWYGGFNILDGHQLLKWKAVTFGAFFPFLLKHSSAVCFELSLENWQGITLMLIVI